MNTSSIFDPIVAEYNKLTPGQQESFIANFDTILGIEISTRASVLNVINLPQKE